MFEIGDKVRCINDSIKPGMEAFVYEAYLNWVKKDKIYTIRGFVNNDGIVTGILLEEIINFPIYIHLINREQEPAFAEWRFAKEESANIEISIESEELVEI